MTGELWVPIIVAVLGGGGLGAVLVNSIANRKKVAADVVATLSTAYETRISALGERITCVESENKLLKQQLDEMKSALMNGNLTNATLQRENADLQEQIDKLSKAVNGRDKRIRELEKQVAELTERLNAMNGDDGNSTP